MKREETPLPLRWDFVPVERTATWQWRAYGQDGTLAMQCDGACKTLPECMADAYRFGYAPGKPKNARGAASDAARINLSDPAEIRWWCREFRCTQKQLLDAIRAEGAIAERVRVYLLAIG